MQQAQGVGNSRHAKDIVQQITDFYIKRKIEIEKVEPLVPTKAALFGLDMRLTSMKDKEYAKTHKNKRVQKKESLQESNRHLYPSENTIEQFKTSQGYLDFFTGGTCYDQQITQKLHEKGLPKKVSYITDKDL